MNSTKRSRKVDLNYFQQLQEASPSKVKPSENEKTDLTRVQQKTESHSTSYPTEKHDEKTKVANSKKENLLNQLTKKEEHIKALREKIKSERKSGASLKQLDALEKKIVSAKKEYKKLNQEIGQIETISGSQDETESYANHSPARKNRKEMKTEELREFSSSSEKVGDDEESTEIYGNESTSSGKETLEERLNILSALLKTKDDEIHEICKKIQELSSHKNLDQKTADQISIELKIKYSERDAVLLRIRELSQKESNAGEINQATKIAVRQIQMDGTNDDEDNIKHAPLISGNIKPNSAIQRTRTAPRENLKGIFSKTQESKIHFPEAEVHKFSPSELAEIAELNRAIRHENHEIKKLNKKIAELELHFDEETEAGREKGEIASKYKALISNCKKELAKILTREAIFCMRIAEIENAPFSATEITANDKEFIASIKSKTTKDLEDTHTKKLEELKQYYQNSYTGHMKISAWNLLAGTLGFGFSFFIANSLSRTSPFVAYFLAPLIGGALHHIFAKPIVMQVAASSWTSPVLAEMENYYKLKAAYIRARRTNTLDEKKYASKNPDHKGKLTIEQRLGEERSYLSMFRQRQLTEEVGYYAYSVNYTAKACFVAGGSKFFHDKNPGSITAETFMHGAAGALSGASYVLAQQYFRSKQPGAKEIFTPTREIFAAEVDMLNSLKDDLKNAANVINAKSAPSEADLKHLEKLKAKLHTTEKSLAVAEAKSRHLGIFRTELENMWKEGNRIDTFGEIAARITTLQQVAGISYLTDGLKQSSDPLHMFLGHAIPAVALIAPPVGFTMRGAYVGLYKTAAYAIFGEGSKPKSVTTNLRRVTVDPASESDTKKHHGNDDGNEEDSVMISKFYDSEDSEEWHGNVMSEDERRV